MKIDEIKKLDELIKAKQQELDNLEDLLTQTNVSNYDERVQTSPVSKNLENTIQAIKDTQTELQNAIQQFIELKVECMKKVDSLSDPKLIAIAYKRYFEFKTFEKIAEEMNLSERWILKLNKKLRKSL